MEIRTSGSMRGGRKRAFARRACLLLYRVPNFSKLHSSKCVSLSSTPPPRYVFIGRILSVQVWPHWGCPPRLGAAGAVERSDNSATDLFIAGAKDPVIASATGKASLAAMKASVPKSKTPVIIEGAGHYIQQERPKEVNAALIEFLRNISGC